LAEAIRNGTYKSGEKLPAERDLAESFQVSRATIREAMIALEIFGVIEIRHGSGIYVVELAPDGVTFSDALPNREDLNVGAFELIEARILIEGETAAVAAAAVSDDDIEILNTLVRRMGDDDIAVSEVADREFHNHLARITENGALIDAIDHLWDLRTQSPLASQIMTRARGGGRAERIAEHGRIVEALKTRNSGLARQAMREHLEKVREYLLDATESTELENLRQILKAKRASLSKRTGY